MWRLGIANIASYVAYGFIDVTVCNDQIGRAVQIGIPEAERLLGLGSY